ncbi:MAG: DUF3847 domain-containing protein [Tissierellia bacterium]|nr:DUF3847 domain-containing protein [Tissierellia bacterium]
MEDNKNFKQVKKEIEKLDAEKEQYEVKLEQLKNQEKKIRRKISQEERKRRPKRLIERGAILESFIDEASEKSNEEIKAILQTVFNRP